MTPVVLLISIFVFILLYFLFKNELQKKIVKFSDIQKIKTEGLIKDRQLLKKSLIILILVLLGFFTHSLTHIEALVIALTGAFMLLLITGDSVEKIYEKIEW